ncbi:MAG: GFA family protein [Roseovarius sp.]
MKRNGSCLCGAVTYEIADAPGEAGVCHCGMCRKWTGGINVAMHLKAEDVVFEGSEAIAHYTSSEWAERGFCSRCGSSLYYRMTAEGPMQGDLFIGLGTLDDTDGLRLTEEIFIDRKPAFYSFAEETRKMTEGEFMEMVAAPPPG